MMVSLKSVRNSVELTGSAKKQLHELKELSHENINKFVGACIDSCHAIVVFQYCERGSLEVGVHNCIVIVRPCYTNAKICLLAFTP